MSNQEEDFSQNIDEQLLQNVEDSSSPDVRIKLERIAHAASLSKPQQQQQPQDPQQSQQPQQQGTTSVGSASPSGGRRNKRSHADSSSVAAAAAAAEYKKQFEQLQQQQQHAQQQHLTGLPHQSQQVQLQHQHQQQLAHHHHHQHPQYPHELTGAPGPDDLSEYNIQIPDPIIDSKLKIYPVSENTITADGNLITDRKSVV